MVTQEVGARRRWGTEWGAAAAMGHRIGCGGGKQALHQGAAAAAGELTLVLLPAAASSGAGEQRGAGRRR